MSKNWGVMASVLVGALILGHLLFSFGLAKASVSRIQKEAWLQKALQCTTKTDNLELYRGDNWHLRWIKKLLTFVEFEEPRVEDECQSILEQIRSEQNIPEAGDEVYDDFLRTGLAFLIFASVGVVAWMACELMLRKNDQGLNELKPEEFAKDIREGMEMAAGSLKEIVKKAEKIAENQKKMDYLRPLEERVQQH